MAITGGDGLWLAAAAITLHGIAQKAPEDDAAGFVGCCGLPIDPVDNIS